MRAGLARRVEGFGVGWLSWKAVLLATCLGIALSPTGLTASAAGGENETEDRAAGYESKIYGTVEKVPPGLIGVWVIGKRDVVVTRETRISERHGKAAVGAYVEVEGNNTGKMFSATRMEVKRSKTK